MKFRNYFTALFPSLIDREGYYEIQKEMNFKSVENTMFNRFAGKGSFLAVVLPEDISSTDNRIAFNAEKSLRVRPLDIHDFIIPEPCSSNDPEQIKKIIAMHPIAYPDNSAPEGGDEEKANSGLVAGQIVECFFMEAGPDDAGSLRGLRYRLKKESTVSRIGLSCIGGQEAGAKSSFTGSKYNPNSYSPSPDYTGTSLSVADRVAVIIKAYPQSKPIAKEIVDVADRLGTNAYWLADLINFESARTFLPSTTNDLGFVGLIQFGDGAAKDLGTTQAALKEMTAKQQMVFVERYFNLPHKRRRSTYKKKHELYMAVFYPASIGKDPRTYRFPDNVIRANNGIATPLDYVISAERNGRIKE